MRLTAELNGSYHSPAEVRDLFSQITGVPARVIRELTEEELAAE